MESNNKIIERILQDARDKCDDILNKAKSQKEKLLSENTTRLLSARQKLEKDCQIQGDTMASNELANAALELKKLRLKRKRELLDEAYKEAYNRVLNLTRDEYLTLISRSIKAHASNGEVVDIAKRDVNAITAQFLDKLGLGLKLGSVCEIEGGVILRGQGYSKDLSIKSLFEVIRENTEIEIAQILFGRP